MPPPFRCFTVPELVAELAAYPWSRRVWRVDMHHTYYPARRDYRGLTTIEAMWRFHVEDRGFDDLAQHLSIGPEGSIWTGRDWNKRPASVGGTLNRGAFMFEMIGNFDIGHDVLDGAQLEVALLVTRAVQRCFRLPPEALLFHRDIPGTAKTCPGSSIAKSDILQRLHAMETAGLGTLDRSALARLA